MNPSVTTPDAGRQLSLPMMTFFSVRTKGARTVAHALHFDLVATAPTKSEALRKLRAAVKHHIEYGLKNGLDQNDILLNAPKECWDKMMDAPLTLGEVIEIDNQRIQTVTGTAIDETDASLKAA